MKRVHKIHPKRDKTACGIFLLDLMLMYSYGSKQYRFVTCKRCLKKRPPVEPAFECNCGDLRTCKMLYGNKHGAVDEMRKRAKHRSKTSPRGKK